MYILCLYMVYTLFIAALKRFPKMSPWRNVGMLVPSFSLPASSVHRGGDHQRIHPTDAVPMTALTTWSSSARLRS